MVLSQPKTQPVLGMMMLILPGPDRRRSHSLYQYRVTYRSTDPDERGCIMTWDVTGGRLPYQVAVERTVGGELRWHCSCADAVYRGEDNPNHLCKHVAGLIETIPTIGTPVRREMARAA
jgi:hypothetical protein